MKDLLWNYCKVNIEFDYRIFWINYFKEYLLSCNYPSLLLNALRVFGIMGIELGCTKLNKDIFLLKLYENYENKCTEIEDFRY